MQTRIINLAGGPCVGKSTVAAGLFHMMKSSGESVELIDEYAKELTWDKRYSTLADQLYILAKQNRKQARLVGEVEYVITDCPLILGMAYVPEAYYYGFESFLEEVFSDYNNSIYLIERDHPYVEAGRNQTEEQAQEKHEKIKDFLKKYSYNIVHANEWASHKIYKNLQELKKKPASTYYEYPSKL